MDRSQNRQISMTDIKVRQPSKVEGRYYTLEQSNDWLQCLFCCFCQSSNEYTISESDPNFNINTKKGHIKETSDCLARLFCVCNRPFQAKLRLFNQDIAVADRPCRQKLYEFRCCLEFMPCGQNEIVVSNKGGRILGYLKVGCWCCSGNYYSCADSQIQIFSGETESMIYRIQGSYCQRSLCLPFCRLCYFPNIQYDIFDTLNMKVGKVLNLYNGCITQCLTRTDKFGVEFPAKADDDQKILLLFGAMYLDYLRYETPLVCGGFR